LNVNLLIDAIVRQTTVLIAQLATTAGVRAPLAHVANQVFLDLASELKAQGLGHKVIADMFGMALRTYHARVQRLSESATDRGRSLWEAVLGYVQEQGQVTGSVRRAEILRRFRRDDEATVRGVLRDLTESGLIFKSGRGDTAVYRAAGTDDVQAMGQDDGRAAESALLWVTIHRSGPIDSVTLAEQLRREPEELEEVLDSLVEDGRVFRMQGDDGETLYDSAECVISYENTVGWEAAVFDHYQAMVSALCTKLAKGSRSAAMSDAIGGSTYVFDLSPGHPMETEILGFLKRVRTDATALRARLDEVNANNPDVAVGSQRVIFYAGQTVQLDEPNEEAS